MQLNLTTVTLIVVFGACLAFVGAAWMKKRTVYLPAQADSSQPPDAEAEKKREQKARARGASLVWTVWMFGCVILYAIALLGPTFRKVSAALADPTGTPTGTATATITPTPTITRTPRDTSTPRATWTPIGGTGVPAGSLMTDILTMQVSPTAGATATARVVTNVVVQTKIVNVVQTVIVSQQIVITVPVVQTVIVPIYQTVVVTPTFTETPTPTPTFTETPTPTPTITETPTP